MSLGVPDIYELIDRGAKPRFIISFPTKYHWKDESRLEQIDSGIKRLGSIVRENSIKSIAVPALGCTNGQLDWASVSAVMYRGLSRIGADVEFFAPLGANEASRQLPEMIAQKSIIRSRSLVPEPSLPTLAVILAEAIHRARNLMPERSLSKEDLSGLFRSLASKECLAFDALSDGKASAKLFSEYLKALENNWLVVRVRAAEFPHSESFDTGPAYLDAKLVYAEPISKFVESINSLIEQYQPANQLSFMLA
jgi:hypothetical protein